MGFRKKIEEIRSRVGLSNIRLDQLRNSVRSLKSIEEQQSKEIERLRSELKTNAKKINLLSEEVKKEFQRRDIWAMRDAEVQYLAQGKEIWVIKCPAPERGQWTVDGDYAYCLNIKKHLENMGIYAVVDFYEDWNCPIDADVVLVMYRRHGYRPNRRNKRTRYVCWMVEFPVVEFSEQLCADELNLFDLVLVDSIPYAEALQKKTNTPVKPFYVLTDTELFHTKSNEKEEPKYNRVFVGNTRGIFRDHVRWCEKNGIELDVWGANWEEFISPDNKYIHLHGFVEYTQLPDIYRNARVVINEHYRAMLDVEMLNNRFPEVLLCGTPMICDWTESFERNYGDMVLFYRNEEEFVRCMKEMEERYDELRANVLKNQDKLKEEFDFRRGIQRMKALIDGVSK